MKQANVICAIFVLATFLHCGFGVDAAEADFFQLESTVTHMAAIGSASSPSFAPDGRMIAFVSDISGTPQIWTVPTEGGWPTQVTALEHPVGKVLWSPSGEWLAFTSAPGGGSNTQVYVVRAYGTELRRLTDGGNETNYLGDWADDGGALAIASNRLDHESMDAFLYEPDEGAWRLIADNEGIGTITDVSPDGSLAVLWRMQNRSRDNLFLRAIDSGEEYLLTPYEGPGTFNGGIFAGGNAIYLLSNGGRDLIAFARILLDGANDPSPIEIVAERPDAELWSFDLTPDDTAAALVWNSAGRSELEFFDFSTSERQDGPALPAEIVRELTFSADGRLLAMVLSGSTKPADIWVYDRVDGRLWQVTHSSHPGIALDLLIRPEFVRYSAHDGLPLTGWLYQPHGRTGPVPIVLSFHGGPEGQERPTFRSDYQALVALGIAVFAPNVRGSSGFGKAFANLDNGELRFDAIRDIEASVRYLVDEGIADSERVGVMGGSYGGYMTMAGVTEYPELFAAAANLYGIVNFETFFQHSEPWMAAISTVEYGNPDTEVELLRRLSPIHNLDRVVAPTIVLHGANDTNVPVIEAEQLVSGLRARGVSVDFVLYPDEGHGFNTMANRIDSTMAIANWFFDHLGE